jgi:Protein of unknown function DUF262
MELKRSELELETIVQRIERGELDLQPEFQRGEIWDNKRRQRLIDSMLRNWYVPAVHIVHSSQYSSDIVLDGQQRLVAIRDFFHNDFPVDGKIVPASEKIRQLDGLRYSQLPPDVKRGLVRFTLTFVTLYEFEPEEPNELFFRLNQSYNLTPPEKRNALHGRARGQVKDVVRELEDLGLLTPASVGFSNGRLAYDDIVARTCLALERGNIRQHINNNVVEEFYRTQKFSEDTLTSIRRAGADLYTMCQQLTERVRFNKATLFSWLIFCGWTRGLLGQPPPATLLTKFEGHRRALKKRNEKHTLSSDTAGAILLYDDRASYRGTDVSSVLARDCVLYLFFSQEHKVPDFRGSDDLRLSISGQPESMVQQQILNFVTSDHSTWGANLRRAESAS